MSSANESNEVSRMVHDLASTVKKDFMLVHTPCFKPELFAQERERLKSSESDRLVPDLVLSKQIPKLPSKISVDLRKSIGSLSLTKSLRQPLPPPK